MAEIGGWRVVQAKHFDENGVFDRIAGAGRQATGDVRTGRRSLRAPSVIPGALPLSGGQRQRVALARALATEPELLPLPAGPDVPAGSPEVAAV